MQAVQRLDLGPSVAAVVKLAIFRGELAPGARLVEADLAREFGTSRGPVRDALVELEQSGLVENRPRRGCVVREFGAADVEEIYSLRLVLESLAIDRVVQRTDVDLGAALDDALAALDRAHAEGDRVAIGAADMAFHRAIVELSGHGRALQGWQQLADQTRLLMTVLSGLDSVIQGPAGDHHVIALALAARDGAGARAALAAHLDSAHATMTSATT